MEPVQLVFSTPPTTPSQNLVYATKDTSRISAFVSLDAMLMKLMLMALVSAGKDTTSLATAADFALLLRFMTPPTEFATFPARTTKCGTPSSELVDAFLDITLSTVFAQPAMSRLNTTTMSASAATVWKVTKRLQVRDVKANVFLFAQPTKITF